MSRLLGKILPLALVVMGLLAGVGMTSCGGGDPDAYKVCCGCLSANHCWVTDPPVGPDSIVSWCRGQLQEGEELDYHDGCVEDNCWDECDILY